MHSNAEKICEVKAILTNRVVSQLHHDNDLDALCQTLAEVMVDLDMNVDAFLNAISNPQVELSAESFDMKVLKNPSLLSAQAGGRGPSVFSRRVGGRRGQC